jgi:hypothetical protein
MLNETIQLIWNGCDETVFADNCDRAELPDYPISNGYGGWISKPDFEGQKVVWTTIEPHLGFLAVEADCPLDDDNYDYDGLFWVEGKWYAPI